MVANYIIYGMAVILAILLLAFRAKVQSQRLTPVLNKIISSIDGSGGYRPSPSILCTRKEGTYG